MTALTYTKFDKNWEVIIYSSLKQYDVMSIHNTFLSDDNGQENTQVLVEHTLSLIGHNES